MSNFSRQVRRNQARQRKKDMKRRMRQAQQGESQMSESALWQGKYDQKVQEVAVLRSHLAQLEATVAALILDNGPGDSMTMLITNETVQFIADGGVQGLNKEPNEDGLTIEVVLSPEAEEVEDDDVPDDEDSEDAGGEEEEDEDSDG